MYYYSKCNCFNNKSENILLLKLFYHLAKRESLAKVQQQDSNRYNVIL